MAKFVIIKPHDERRPVEIIQIHDDTPTHIVVEAFQRGLRNGGKRDGVTYQTHEGNIVSAMVASTKL